jgi:hypothetical protein
MSMIKSDVQMKIQDNLRKVDPLVAVTFSPSDKEIKQ